MKKVLIGVAVVVAAVALGLGAIAHLRKHEAIESVESHLLAKGADGVRFEFTNVVFDWKDVFVCGKALAANEVTIDAMPAQAFYFDYFKGEAPSLFTATTTEKNPTICQMDMPWWWIRW